MSEITILKNQRLIDVTIQQLGDVERIFELAQLNGVGITDELEAGTVLQIPDYDKSVRGVVQVFNNNSVWPASADEQEITVTLPPGGLGFMKIRDVSNPSIHDFIVS